MRESSLRVSRTARVCTLGEVGPATRQVWIVCHGYGQLASRFLRRFESLDDGSRLIVAPEALNRFYLDSSVGATWMTSHERLSEIDDYVAYLDRVHAHTLEGIDRDRVELIALGFSQGMSTVARWAARTHARIDRLLLWSGSWPPELEPTEGMFRGAYVSLVGGTADATTSGAAFERLRDRLAAAGIAVDFVTYEGGHDVEPEPLRRLAGHRREA
jgi:predicted esterase